MFSGFAVPASSASRSRSPPRSIAPRAAVHRPRQGAARQPLRRPHPGDRHSGDRDADRRKPCPVVADRGYRGHNAQPDHKFKVYISGQRRRVTETIKRELRRRSAVEPVIGHSQGRASHGTKLPRRDPRRRRKRRPRRRRLQLVWGSVRQASLVSVLLQLAGMILVAASLEFRGEHAMSTQNRAAYLYSVGPDADHDAAMRICGEAPEGGPILPSGTWTVL